MGGFLDFFSVYTTPKYVAVTSRRLGLLYYALVLLVVLYSFCGVFLFRSFRGLESLNAFIDVTVKNDKTREGSCAGVTGTCRVVRATEVVVRKELRSVAIALSRKENHTLSTLISAPVFKLDHSVFSEGDFFFSGRAMRGRLFANGSVMRELHEGHSDHISMEELWRAAGVDVNAKSDVPGEEESTLRERGFHLIVSVFYSDNDEHEVFKKRKNYWFRC
jgi:hypothetical protein